VGRIIHNVQRPTAAWSARRKRRSGESAKGFEAVRLESSPASIRRCARAAASGRVPPPPDCTSQSTTSAPETDTCSRRNGVFHPPKVHLSLGATPPPPYVEGGAAAL
jgi:hypothetical protein